MKKSKKGFTLVELLVVVLIIGILAAIAVPQYQEAVEKSIMQEAIVNLKTIAKAQDIFYLQNDRYAKYNEMDKLDISIPGEIKDYSQTTLAGDRVMTKYFIYASGWGGGEGAKSVAHRVQDGVSNYQDNAPYYIHINTYDRLYCTYNKGNNIQKKLCTQISQKGYL